jgi:hypothetical protein
MNDHVMAWTRGSSNPSSAFLPLLSVKSSLYSIGASSKTWCWPSHDDQASKLQIISPEAVEQYHREGSLQSLSSKLSPDSYIIFHSQCESTVRTNSGGLDLVEVK